MSRTWKWTRERYKRAASLTRLLAGRCEPALKQPEPVWRYLDLQARHPSRDGPLLEPLWSRLSKYSSAKDTPF